MGSHHHEQDLALDAARRYANRGALREQQVLAGGTLLLHEDADRTRLADSLQQLRADAELRAIAAVRACAALSPLLGEADLRDVSVRLQAAGAGDDASGASGASGAAADSVHVRVLVKGIARRALDEDALAGAAAALGMLAARIPASTIDDLRVFLHREGGTQRRHPQPLPDDVAALLPAQAPLAGVRATVITLSDRAARGVYEDRSGARRADILRGNGALVVDKQVLPDDADRLAAAVEVQLRRGDIDLIACTGGTGLGPRDITPETLLRLGLRVAPGIGDWLRRYSAEVVRSAWLSRAVAGTLGHSLVIALPGSEKAVVENMDALLPLLPHTLRMLRGEGHE
jgi:molybdenum cofactor synthesis domain-containing protein